MHQSRRVTARGQNPRDEVFLADVALVDMLDAHASGFTHLVRTLPDAVTQRFGKVWVVENANAMRVKKARHPARVARPGQRARHNDSVVARQHAMQVRRIAFFQHRCRHGLSPRLCYAFNPIFLS